MAKQSRYCFYHDDVPAAGHCRQCHKPVCEDCSVIAGEAVFCSEECVHKFAAFKERYGEGDSKRTGCLKRIISIVAGLAVILIIVKVLAIMGISAAQKLLELIFGS